MKKLLLFSFLSLILFSFLHAQVLDSIIDLRNGQIYRLVKIGAQWWMQENLDIGTMIDSTQTSKNNGIIEKYYYRNSASLGAVYGGLYSWNEMMDYENADYGNPGSTQGICPAGLRIPTSNEWSEMLNFLGGNSIAGGKLKESGTIHWLSPNDGATNESGFTALPGGYRHYTDDFFNLNETARFWTGTGTTSPTYISLDYSDDNVIVHGVHSSSGFSIRCIEDQNRFSKFSVSDKYFKKAVNLHFNYGNNVDTLFLINSGLINTIHITSINTGTEIFTVNRSTASVGPGDTAQLQVTFNPPELGVNYYDNLQIESDDPDKPEVIIPLSGYGFEMDSIIDIRDNQVYKIVVIGKQWWLAENLNIGSRIDVKQDASDNGNIEKYCYDDKDSLCNIYGGLYQYDEMMQYSQSETENPGPTQGISPPGWHIPTKEEWNTLFDFVGGSSSAGGILKEAGTTHWSAPNTNSSDLYSFKLLPGGFRNFYDDSAYYGNLGQVADLWYSVECSSNSAWRNRTQWNSSGVSQYCSDKVLGLSVRSIRDSCHGFLAVCDEEIQSVTKLNIGYDNYEKIIIYNTAAGKTFNISSIHTGQSEFSPNSTSSSMSPGDSIHVKVFFNPLHPDEYSDTLFIESDDPFCPMIKIPLSGYRPVEDSIFDIRDGQTYGIVKIGRQWWMQENLNIGTYVPGYEPATDDGRIEKYCYGYNPSKCDVYGGLYQWNEMMAYGASDSSNPGNTRGICPAGWHLPTYDEWFELFDYLGGEDVAGGKMKDFGTDYWNSPNTGATNETGFTALPGGYSYGIGYYLYMWQRAYFWSTTEFDNLNAWRFRLFYNSTEVLQDEYHKEEWYSIRCITDSSEYAYITVADTNLDPVPSLSYHYTGHLSDEIVLVNSSKRETVNISSVSTNSSAFKLNYSSGSLSPGDSMHLTILFDPPEKIIYYDSLFIRSNDPRHPTITIPIFATFPLENSFADSMNISCNGYADGSATIGPVLGYPPYTCQWHNTAATTEFTLTGLAANEYYKVTIWDSLGHSVTDSIILSAPETLELVPQYSDTICLYSHDGFVDPDPHGGTAPYFYQWSTGDTNITLTDIPIGDYKVVVTDSHGCSDSTSVSIYNAVPFEDENICIVTIDLSEGKFLIVWEKTQNRGTAFYNIYREDNLIGTVPYNDLSVFKDSVADPEKRPYLYQISVVDTCGNESSLSPYHKPHFLQYVSSEGGVNLTWGEYEVQGDTIDFGSYSIYRGSDSTALAPIEENIPIVINMFTDNDDQALKKKYYYRVAGNLINPCYPSSDKKADPGPYSHAFSNVEENRLNNNAPTGIDLTNNVIPENQPALTFVGRFSAIDEDTADTHTYLLVDGDGAADNNKFIIQGDSLISAGEFDFETRSSYSIRIQCKDSGTDNLIFEKIFTIYVTDLNETGFMDVYATNLKIYPNPFEESTTLKFNNPQGESYRLYIIDLSGQVYRIVENITTSQYVLKKGEMDEGMYFIKLVGSRIYRGKIVIE